MKSINWVLFLLVMGLPFSIIAQKKASAKELFYSDNTTLSATITTNLKEILKNEDKAKAIDGTFSCTINDSVYPVQNIKLSPRGEFRRKNCAMPSMKLDFTGTVVKPFNKFKQVKMVTPCDFTSKGEVLLIKEYLIYKMYNELTPMSFRVRLMKLELKDIADNKKPIVRHAFLIEDVDDMAERNDCNEFEGLKVNTEATDRAQMTLVNLFQFMIGNTDFAVPVYHNVKLIRNKDTATNFRPYAVPYDFDYCGLVDAIYAIPDPLLGTTTVRERVYRGFARTKEELQTAIDIFNAKKEAMYKIISSSTLIGDKVKSEMMEYLDEYYAIIRNDALVKSYFITGARTK